MERSTIGDTAIGTAIGVIVGIVVLNVGEAALKSGGKFIRKVAKRIKIKKKNNDSSEKNG